MIELILEIPMELKVIIGSGIIMGLLQYKILEECIHYVFIIKKLK